MSMGRREFITGAIPLALWRRQLSRKPAVSSDSSDFWAPGAKAMLKARRAWNGLG
jgi:hypothetical protein